MSTLNSPFSSLPFYKEFVDTFVTPYQQSRQSEEVQARGKNLPLEILHQDLRNSADALVEAIRVLPNTAAAYKENEVAMAAASYAMGYCMIR